MAVRQTVAELIYKITGDIKGITASVKTAEAQVKGLGTKFKGFNLKSVAAFAGVTAGVGFLGQALRTATNNAALFDDRMRRVNTITRLGAEEFKNLKKEILDLSTKTRFSATELADGLFDVASAGVEAENQMAFLKQAAIFATAGTTTLSASVQGLTAVIKGYGLQTADAIRVSDLYFKTNELGQTTVDQIATSIQKVTAQAKLSGLTLEELFGVYSTFTGVTGNAAEVTTQLTGALNALAAPTQEARTRFDQLGVEVGAAAIKKKGFAAVAKDVFEAVDGDVEALRKLIPEINGARLIAALATEQFDDFEDKTLKLGDAAGSTQLAFGEMEESASSDLAKFRGSINLAGIVVGETFAGLLKVLGQFVLDMAKSLKLVKAAFVATFKAVPNFVAVGILTAQKKILDFSNNTIDTINSLFERLGIDKRFKEIGGDTKILQDAIDNLVDETAGFGKEFEDVFKDATKSSEELTAEFVRYEEKQEKLKKALESGQDPFSKTGEASNKAAKELEGLQQKMVNIIDSSIELRDKLGKDLTNAMNKFGDSIRGVVAEGQTELANIVIGAEESIADLEQRIEQARASEDSGDTVANLQKEVAAQQKILQARKGFEERQAKVIEDVRTRLIEAGVDTEVLKLQDVRTFEEELEEQRRIAALDAFSRFEEEQTKKILRLADDFINEVNLTREKIEKQKSFEEDLTEFLENANEVRSSSVDEWAANTIAKHQAVAASLRNIISLQSQVASIPRRAQFHTGGFVGAGGGDVHAGEYVIPANMVSRLGGFVGQLEQLRRSGGTNSVTNNRNVNAPITINSQISDGVDARAVAREFAFELRRV